ncbi:hypothetical protein EGI26_12740 [Lacihabitans sp. CCS-44]|nr:hypothetical protein [Lacihabitans sp. CCS-44]
MVTANGVVLDDLQKKPLEGVLVRNLISLEDGEKTKSDGGFSKMEVGRANGKCPEFNLEFSKDGYISDTIFIENAAPVTIYLKKK